MKRKINLLLMISLYICLGIILGCSPNSGPIYGPALEGTKDNQLPAVIDYEIITEHWVTDCETGNSDDSEIFQGPMYTWGLGKYAYANKWTNDYINTNNHVWQMYFEFDGYKDDLIWNPFETKSPDLTYYGNAIIFKARAIPGKDLHTPILRIQPEDFRISEDGDKAEYFSHVDIPLSIEWQEYIIFFHEFQATWGASDADFTQLARILWYPRYIPYARVKIHIDDIRIVLAKMR